MAECKACGREAGINRVYCDQGCYDLVHKDVAPWRENGDPTMMTPHQVELAKAFEDGRKYEREQVIRTLFK